MSEVNRRNYYFTDEDIRILNGAALLPRCLERSELLMRYFDKEIKDSVKFADVVGSLLDMMVTIENNTKEVVEFIGITEFGMHPDKVQCFNLPTVMGAFNGYKLAAGVDENKLCDGCAFIKGTPANTCQTTVFDAQYQEDNTDDFWCHKEFDCNGKPTKKCIGFMKKRKTHD